MYFKKSFFYRIGTASNKRSSSLKLLIPLTFPYLTLALLYSVLRANTLPKISLGFWVVVIIASTWFAFGPQLVYKFINLFVSFQTDPEVCNDLRAYFRSHEFRHYKYYKRCVVGEGLLLILFALCPIVYFPEILTKNITHGLNDPFFWIILVFLAWFLFYCANATAFISLIAFKIIHDIKKDKVLNYNPVNSSHHRSIEKLLNLCNKAVAYTCTGLVFLPLGVYFIFQQPAIYFKLGASALMFTPANSPQPIYLIWVLGVLLIYCFFLFFFITYPKAELKAYIKNKSKSFLLKEESDYILRSSSTVRLNRTSLSSVEEQLRKINAYLKLQEIKSVCKTQFALDSSTVVAYFTIFATVFSTIPGFVQILRYTSTIP